MWITIVPLLLLPPIDQDLSTPLAHFATRERALALVDKGRFEDALPLLIAITEKTPYDGEAWLGRANGHQLTGDFDAAVEAFDRARELGFGDEASVHFDVARCHAQAGRPDEAFAALERSLAARLDDRGYLPRDGWLTSLHGDERWSAAAGLLTEKGLSPTDGWRLDLLYLEQEIQRLHAVEGGQAAPREEIAAAVAELYERMPELPEHRIPLQMQRVMRLLNDGHSVVYPVSHRAPPTQLPLRMWWFPEGIHVIDARAGHEEWIGCRLVSIGSGRAERFAKDLAPLVSRDNSMGILWIGPMYLTIAAVLHDMGYVPSVESIPVVLEDRDGNRREVTFIPEPMRIEPQRLVSCSLAPETPRYLERTDEPYWFEEIRKGVLFVQFNQVVDAPLETLSAFAKRVRAAVSEQEIDHLILDLRHNNGGKSRLYTEMVRTLVHFETTRPGRLFVLMGRNTYSAAQLFLTDVERFTNPILVGEPSGSRPNVVSNESNVVLPFSGTQASVSHEYMQQGWPSDDRIWIVPDMPVELGIEAYLAGRDPALEVVLEYLDQLEDPGR